tara:strand:- start:384 stop:2342 length:1959 start_codon:yes stop_codon:yes gene_type:complete
MRLFFFIAIFFSSQILISDNLFYKLNLLEICNSKTAKERPIYYCLGFPQSKSWDEEYAKYGDPEIDIIENLLINYNSNKDIDISIKIVEGEYPFSPDSLTELSYLSSERLVKFGKSLPPRYRNSNVIKHYLEEEESLEVTGKTLKDWGINKINRVSYRNEVAGRLYDTYININLPVDKVEQYCSIKKEFDFDLFKLKDSRFADYHDKYDLKRYRELESIGAYESIKSDKEWGAYFLSAGSYPIDIKKIYLFGLLNIFDGTNLDPYEVYDSHSRNTKILSSSRIRDLNKNKIDLQTAFAKDKIEITNVSINIFDLVSGKGYEPISEEKVLDLFDDINHKAFCNITLQKKIKKENKSVIFTTNVTDVSPIVHEYFKKGENLEKLSDLKFKYTQRLNNEKRQILEDSYQYSDRKFIEMIKSRKNLIEATKIDFEDTVKIILPKKGEFEKTTEFERRKQKYLDSIDFGKFYGYCFIKNEYDPDNEVFRFDVPDSCKIDSDYHSWSGVSASDIFGNPTDIQIKFTSNVLISFKAIPPKLILGDPDLSLSCYVKCLDFRKTIEVPTSIQVAKKIKDKIKVVLIFEYDKHPNNRRISSRKIEATVGAPTLRYENTGSMESTILGYALINEESKEIIYFNNIIGNNFKKALKTLDEEKIF